jgi:transposase
MTRTLRPSDEMPRIYLHREPVDFRIGFRGLGALVEQALEHNPFDGGLYAFTNQQHNKINVCIGKTTALCCITKAWPKQNSAGQINVMSSFH